MSAIIARRRRARLDVPKCAPRSPCIKRRELLLTAAAAPVALTLPVSAYGAAACGTPLALVTADSEDRVLVVRLTDMKVVRSLVVPAQPYGIEAVDLLRSC